MAGMAALSVACAGDPAAVEPIGPDVLTESGGCNQAVFWAADEAGTLALRLSFDIGGRRDFEDTISLPVSSPSLIELKRGVGLRQALCGDAITEPYEETSSTRPVSGTLTLRVGPAPTDDCGATGELELRDVEFDDGTVIDSYTIRTESIGCFAG